MTIRVKSVFNFKSVSVASSTLHCHVVYTYGFNGLTPCACVPVYNGPLIVPRVTSTLCGDRGWVLLRVRRRASDGSCGRVTSVFVSFSGLHESEQFRCVVDVVLCIGNCSECFAVGCFHIPVAQCSLAPAPCKDVVWSMSVF